MLNCLVVPVLFTDYKDFSRIVVASCTSFEAATVYPFVVGRGKDHNRWLKSRTRRSTEGQRSHRRPAKADEGRRGWAPRLHASVVAAGRAKLWDIS